MLPKVNIWKKTFLLFSLGMALGVNPLFAENKKDYELLFGGGYAMQPYPLNEWGENFQAKNVLGFTATILEKQDPIWSYGLSQYRFQSEAGNTFFFMDGFDVVIDAYWWGDQEKITQKLPFWEKLYSHVGGKFGYYRAFVTGDHPTTGSENRPDDMFQGEGWSFTFYASLGLGRLGMLEYSNRTHLSGGYDNHVLNKAYLSYIYKWAL